MQPETYNTSRQIKDKTVGIASNVNDALMSRLTQQVSDDVQPTKEYLYSIRTIKSVSLRKFVFTIKDLL